MREKMKVRYMQLLNGIYTIVGYEHDSVCMRTRFGDNIWFDGKGSYHRSNGPAMEYSNGCMQWYNHGELLQMSNSSGQIIWKVR